LCEVLAVRYNGVKRKGMFDVPALRLSTRQASRRARLIGALFRVAYPMSAAMPGILPRIGFEFDRKALLLKLPRDLAFLDGEHLRARLEQLAGVAGFKTSAVV